MTKTATYVVYGGAGIVLLLAFTKLQSARSTSSANQSSLTGLTGGGIREIGSAISRGFSSLFGGSAGEPAAADYDSTQVNSGALSFLTPSQQLDLGMQVPDRNEGGSFFGPDINPSTGAYAPGG